MREPTERALRISNRLCIATWVGFGLAGCLIAFTIYRAGIEGKDMVPNENGWFHQSLDGVSLPTFFAAGALCLLDVLLAWISLVYGVVVGRRLQRRAPGSGRRCFMLAMTTGLAGTATGLVALVVLVVGTAIGLGL